MSKEDLKRYHEMQAYWWMASAQTGHAGHRRMFKSVGGQSVDLTWDEKISEAMETSQTHMNKFWELANS